LTFLGHAPCDRFAKKRGVPGTEVVVKLLGWALDAAEADESPGTGLGCFAAVRQVDAVPRTSLVQAMR
jgi:hypothetical protein